MTIFLSTNVAFCALEPLAAARKGLRFCVIVGAVLMFAGCALRSGVPFAFGLGANDRAAVAAAVDAASGAIEETGAESLGFEESSTEYHENIGLAARAAADAAADAAAGPPLDRRAVILGTILVGAAQVRSNKCAPSTTRASLTRVIPRRAHHPISVAAFAVASSGGWARQCSGVLDGRERPGRRRAVCNARKRVCASSAPRDRLFSSSTVAVADRRRPAVAVAVAVARRQPFFQCTPALLAGTWFGPNERVLATTIAINANQIGIAASYFVGATLVHSGAGLHVYFSILTLLSGNGIWNGLGWDGMGWNGMGWDGMGWDGIEWNAVYFSTLACTLLSGNGLGWDWDGMDWNGMRSTSRPSPARCSRGMDWDGTGMEWTGTECGLLLDPRLLLFLGEMLMMALGRPHNMSAPAPPAPAPARHRSLARSLARSPLVVGARLRAYDGGVTTHLTAVRGVERTAPPDAPDPPD